MSTIYRSLDLCIGKPGDFPNHFFLSLSSPSGTERSLYLALENVELFSNTTTGSSFLFAMKFRSPTKTVFRPKFHGFSGFPIRKGFQIQKFGIPVGILVDFTGK
jgi:hypothetical protein